MKFRIFYPVIICFILLLGCAAQKPKHTQDFMWEDIDKDVISFVKSQKNDDKLCGGYKIESKKWNNNKEICGIIISATTCNDVQYFLKVDLRRKKVLLFRPIVLS